MKTAKKLIGVSNRSKTIIKKKNAESSREDVSPGKPHINADKSGPSQNGSLKLKITKKNKPVKTENKLDDKEKKNPELGEQNLTKIQKKNAKKISQKLKKLQGAMVNAQVDAEKGTKAEKSQFNLKKVKGTNNAVQLGGTSEPKNVDKNIKKKQKVVKNNASKENIRSSNQQIEKEPRPSNPALEAATVFIGNLPINTKRVQLANLFKPYGIVNSVRFRTAAGKLIFKHKQRKEAGTLIAYVLLQNEEQAKKALALNGTEFKNNHIRVTAANIKTRDPADNKRTIFVGNLKYTANEEKLREIFSSCGEIDYVRCLQESGKGCKGVAYVSFKAPEAVGLALELNETMLDERPIHVERYSVKKLGAKEARDSTAANELKKPKTGASKRVADKTHLRKKGKVSKNSTEKDVTSISNNKKSEFRGVKVQGVDKNKQKKKKSNSEMKKLAKKIAPINKATK